jgi:ABC-type maltose transport system permease subunit
LVVAPLMVLYMILQRSFIRGIDAASGLTGE